jgi:threonine/homoserine/homoserine lactone efflux protein
MNSPLHELLPAWPLLSAFLAASLVLAITPGPGVFYIVTRSLLQGRRHGLASVAGVALGNLGNAFGASIGLAALFGASSLAFTVVKYAGALYLIYLGVQALRNGPEPRSSAPLIPARLGRVFRDGFVVALLNPKTAVFFAAFLPQFMNVESVGMARSMVLGSIFVAIAAVTDTGYALAAGTIAPMLNRARGLRALGRYLSGGAFMGLGLFTAISGSRGVR